MNTNVICVMQIMWVLHAYICFSALNLMNISILAIDKYLLDIHSLMNSVTVQFTILKKCRLKLDCLIYEMLFIKDRKPPILNTQYDSIKAKLPIWQFKRTTLGILFIDYFNLVIIGTKTKYIFICTCILILLLSFIIYSVFFRDCRDCKVVVACQQFR